ncbi:hypothetical protein KC351_g13484 [Hortaea werneckii]|nr:hypothetical protein KC351_g13484 [Hortaea werneckii]
MGPAKIIDIGVAQKMGDRPEQQDRYDVIRPGRLQQEHIAVFGVYDGHGGTSAVDQIEQEMSSVLASHLESNMTSHQYQDALQNALKDQDAALLATGMSQQGSTAAISILETTRCLLVSADLGDSYVVLAEEQPDEQQRWHVSRLSALQKPSSRMEQGRIEDAGGEINHTYGSARVALQEVWRCLEPSET